MNSWVMIKFRIVRRETHVVISHYFKDELVIGTKNIQLSWRSLNV